VRLLTYLLSHRFTVKIQLSTSIRDDTYDCRQAGRWAAGSRVGAAQSRRSRWWDERSPSSAQRHRLAGSPLMINTQRLIDTSTLYHDASTQQHRYTDGRCLPLLIFPCAIKSRSSPLAPALTLLVGRQERHPGCKSTSIRNPNPISYLWHQLPSSLR